MSENMNGHSILVVEDSEIQREILKRALLARRYVIHTANNGEEGVEIARSQMPSLIISDVMMPVMDGFQMCRKVKGDPVLTGIPLILLTQLDEPEQVIYGLEAGADNYISKPFNMDYLLSKIDVLLNQAHRFRNNPEERCVEFDLDGAHHKIHASRVQTFNFLFSTYENVVQRNLELGRMQIQLMEMNEQLDQRVKQRTAALAAEIVERKSAEETLRAMADAAHDAIINTDDLGTITFWNSAAERMFGRTADAMLGNNISMIFAPGAQDEADQSAAGQLISRRQLMYEARMIRHDGAAFPGEISISPFKAHGRDMSVAIVRDVTERKQWEVSLTETNRKLTDTLEDLRQTQQMLIHNEKMAALGRLSAGVTHEIKNPLNIISTSVQLLQMSLADWPQTDKARSSIDEALSTIMEQVWRSVKICNNLRDFARKSEAVKSDFDLHEFLDKTIALVEYEMKLQDVTIIRDYAPDSITINADQDQIAQVLLNIINNARDSMLEKQERIGEEELQSRGWQRSLKISTALAEGMARITFQDTGMGASRETIQKVFDPFFSTKMERNGTGLGLSISLGIIEAHGGLIKMDAVEGEGAVMTIQLPITAAPPIR